MRYEFKEKTVFYFFIASMCLILCLSGYMYYHKETEKKSKIIPAEDIKNEEVIEKKLNVDKNTSYQIVKEISKAKPVLTYYTEAKSTEQLAKDISKDIDKKSPNLPKVMTDKSDKTVVSPDEDKKQVNVYKINLKKVHKIKAGVSVIDSKVYPTASYQCGRVDSTVHFNNTGIKGVTVSYTLYEW